jgi:hypothetical protein
MIYVNDAELIRLMRPGLPDRFAASPVQVAFHGGE